MFEQVMWRPWRSCRTVCIRQEGWPSDPVH